MAKFFETSAKLLKFTLEKQNFPLFFCQNCLNQNTGLNDDVFIWSHIWQNVQFLETSCTPSPILTVAGLNLL
jgi:hypothetical protein